MKKAIVFGTLLVSFLTSRAQFTNVAPSPNVYTSGKVGIGSAGSTPYFPISLGSNTSVTKIALWENGTSSGAYGLGIGGSQFRLHLGGSTGRFTFLDASGGNEILDIQGNGTTTLNLRANDASFMVDAGSYAAPMMGLKNASGSGWFFTAIASAPGSYSSLAKANDIVLNNRSNAALSNLIVANQSYQASIIFTTKDIVNCCGGDKQRLEIKYDGKVIVGQPSDFPLATPFPAGYNLYVSKGILAEKLQLAVPSDAVNWSDYVFEKNYDLKPLPEVEKYIKANSHLPGVPSASEVYKNGINVVEMDATLLKKIEELTLYVIAQQKKIDALEKRVK